jgi:hypothetical protein
MLQHSPRFRSNKFWLQWSSCLSGEQPRKLASGTNGRERSTCSVPQYRIRSGGRGWRPPCATADILGKLRPARSPLGASTGRDTYPVVATPAPCWWGRRPSAWKMAALVLRPEVRRRTCYAGRCQNAGRTSCSRAKLLCALNSSVAPGPLWRMTAGQSARSSVWKGQTRGMLNGLPARSPARPGRATHQPGGCNSAMGTGPATVAWVGNAGWGCPHVRDSNCQRDAIPTQVTGPVPSAKRELLRENAQTLHLYRQYLHR